MQLFNDYLVRLLKYIEFMKRVVPLHDDLFDFFYEALPGYEEVGRRRVLLGCWGSFNNPDVCDYRYETMTDWGRAMFVTPGVVVDGKLVTTDLVEINLGLRILLGSSFYDDWQERRNVRHARSAGQPGRSAASLEPDDDAQAPETRFRRQLHLGHVAPLARQADRRHAGRSIRAAARWRGSGPRRLAGKVDIGYVKATGSSVKMCSAQDGQSSRTSSSNGRFPAGATPSSAVGRGPIFRPMRPRRRSYFVEKALAEVHAGRLETSTEYKVPEDAIGCGFHEAVRGVLSHHVVIRDGKIANYHPYPPTCWNASPRDSDGVPGPYEDAVQNTPIFEENDPDNFKGIDILRTVRSFDPCLPCGVHMYLGPGRELQVQHSPMFGIPRNS